MDKYLYLAMNGAAQAMLAQQNNANNLANISTVGFKATLDHFVSNPVSGLGHPDRVYVTDKRGGANLSAGALMTTGRDLDIAISGGGWFAVQAEDGNTGYTRRGDLHIDPSGLLLNGANQIVLGEGGPISIPQFESILIGRDGTISVRAAGQAANSLVTVTAGALEASNVNAVDAMVRMMDYARYYEHQIKLMNLASENDAASVRLMRMNG